MKSISELVTFGSCYSQQKEASTAKGHVLDTCSTRDDSPNESA